MSTLTRGLPLWNSLRDLGVGGIVCSVLVVTILLACYALDESSSDITKPFSIIPVTSYLSEEMRFIFRAVLLFVGCSTRVRNIIMLTYEALIFLVTEL